MLNLGNDSTDLIKVDKHENKNLLKDAFEIDDQYKFIKDKDIIDSFQKVFHDYKAVYTPYKKSKNIYVKYLLDKLNVSDNLLFIPLTKNRKIYVKYLLDKLNISDNLPKELYNHFNNSLTNLKFKNKKYLLIMMMMVKCF